MNESLRALPRVDDVLDCINNNMPRAVLVDCIREILGGYRTKANPPFPTKNEVADMAVTLAKSRLSLALRPVINATGIVLHTNLGRAPLAEHVAEHVKQVAMGYSTLEYNIKTGKRGRRTDAVEKLLTDITKAEAACIVNNNAAAVLLALSSLCEGSEVIVSRGELVEIGGSFRVPDVIAQGGAKIREVGTTNKTHLSDYKQAMHDGTSAILKVHTSNYKIMGFTSDVSIAEIAALAKEMDALSIYDLGSGSFVSFAGEPTVQQAVLGGTDIICFSGDKLLGGPQCGIILGKKQFIDKLNKHPLYRALRADKLSLAALEASLAAYRDIDYAKSQIPTLSMLLASPDFLLEKAMRLLNMLDKQLNAGLQKTSGQAGGGSLPTQEFESWAVAIPQCANYTVSGLEKLLRSNSTPIIARIHKDTLLLDARTIDESSFSVIAECLTTAQTACNISL